MESIKNIIFRTKQLGCFTLLSIILIVSSCLGGDGPMFSKIEVKNGIAKVYYKMSKYDLGSDSRPMNNLIEDLLGNVYEVALNYKELDAIELNFVNTCSDEYGNFNSLRIGGNMIYRMEEILKYKDRNTFKTDEYNQAFAKLSFKRGCSGEVFEQ